MNIVISQPMFLPWPGLFEQMRLADVFVHYDDVMLPQGRSFISRVQIKTEKGQEWLTVPLVRRSRGLIKEVKIDQSTDWKRAHLTLLSRALKSAPNLSDASALAETIYDYGTDSLAELNILALELVARYLGFSPRFVRASSVNTPGHSSEKLLHLIKHFDGSRYITGHGAKNYLDHELFEREGIEVRYMEYRIEAYEQFYGEFIPYVTILDGIAHQGKHIVDHFASSTVSWKQIAN